MVLKNWKKKPQKIFWNLFLKVDPYYIKDVVRLHTHAPKTFTPEALGFRYSDLFSWKMEPLTLSVLLFVKNAYLFKSFKQTLDFTVI